MYKKSIVAFLIGFSLIFFLTLPIFFSFKSPSTIINLSVENSIRQLVQKDIILPEQFNLTFIILIQLIAMIIWVMR